MLQETRIITIQQKNWIILQPHMLQYKKHCKPFFWMSFMLVFLILCKREFLLSNWIIKCLMCYKNESLHTHNIAQWCMLLMWCNVDLHLSWKEACYRNNTSVILCLYIYVSKNKLQPVFLYVIYCILQLSNLNFSEIIKCVGLESISC